MICYYVSYLAKAGLQASSIKVYLAALRHTQIARTGMELEHSKMPKLKILQSGIRRTQALLPKQSLTRLPITPAILRKIKEAWSPRAQEEDIIMLWAASALCFFGFFRMGELTTPDDSNYCAQKHLSLGDIAIDSHCIPSVLRIFLKTSKTDREFKGVHIFVGKTGDDLCPVAAVTAFLAIRGNSPGPMFQFKDRTPLTKQRFISHIRKALQSAGIDPTKYAGHSFRIGAATTAAERGIQDSTIKILGRWKSDAYLRYIKIPKEHLAQVAPALSRIV